ncbi:FAD-binding protein [uncultured Jatrophihabitans sp.]|uniref:FAD-binding protein n=1 Tax=uncultured Jatrophihabitans sp. TaxID=1610747 RepID=UPI0035C9C0B6
MADPALLSGWGRTAPSRASVVHPVSTDEVASVVASAGPRGVLARGAGRSYGDAAQNGGGTVVSTRDLTALGPLEPDGTVTCGAGATLADVLAHVVPRGRMLPVLPGTSRVTVGGAVAFDVHGKNHPLRGSFARHVADVELVDGTGRTRVLTAGNPEFDATAGGAGLTGVITAVRLQTAPVATAWLTLDRTRYDDLDDLLAALDDGRGREHRAAWIDTTSRRLRGVLDQADHALLGAVPAGHEPLDRRPRRGLPTPAWTPARTLTPRRIAAFNAARFHGSPRRSRGQVVPLDAGHFPLDRVSGWNRLYGAAGFVQYQCATPTASGCVAVLELLRRRRAPAFLVVLKRLGPGASGHLSFPVEGWTLAVDLPADPALHAVLDDCDELVAAAAGRVYLAKDARLRPDLVAGMYPRLDEWRAVRADLDPRGVFASDLARRLAL